MDKEGWVYTLILSLIIGTLSLAIFYFYAKKLVSPTKRNRSKAVSPKKQPKTKRGTRSHSGIMSSSNSSVSIEIEATDME
ncbi:hypothetical protein NEDG_02060 [Nematocida displodere]|uniref:Uncharacterized protein n=1 Tax=Nematocida displodere TaxID=1805483 RepID=A0A177EMU2_9MICR|nr:hypothetical protein NEDG_02060 [Nematocida displodere]